MTTVSEHVMHALNLSIMSTRFIHKSKHKMARLIPGTLEEDQMNHVLIRSKPKTASGY